MRLADIIPCPGCGKRCPSQLEDVIQYESESGAPQPGNQWLFCSDCNGPTTSWHLYPNTKRGDPMRPHRAIKLA